MEIKVRTWKDNEYLKGTHPLDDTEGGKNRNKEKKRASEENLHPVTEGQKVRRRDERERVKDTHFLDGAEGVISLERGKSRPGYRTHSL
jgi:hypothetical protein